MRLRAGVQATGYRLQATGYRVQGTGAHTADGDPLRASRIVVGSKRGYRLQATGYRIVVGSKRGYRLQATGYRLSHRGGQQAASGRRGLLPKHSMESTHAWMAKHSMELRTHVQAEPREVRRW